MHARRLAIAILVIAVLVVAALILGPTGSPVRLTCVHSTNSTVGTRVAALQMVSCSSEIIYFAENQRIQFRVANRWTEPERLSAFDCQYLLPRRSGREFMTVVPHGAEECRLLLVYTLNAPNLRALECLTTRGWYGRFPKFCGWVAACFPKTAGRRYITPKANLTQHVEATKPDLDRMHNLAAAVGRANSLRNLHF
jgi:hypothetical protein